MVWSSIKQNDGVASPINVFAVELKYQLSEIYVHHSIICIRLEQGQVSLSVGIETKEHRDSRLDADLWNGVGCSIWPPLHPAEITHREPSLIKVQDPVSLFQQPDELQCKLLSKYQVLFRVGVHCYCFNSSISHSEIFFEDFRELPWLFFNFKSLLELFSEA